MSRTVYIYALCDPQTLQIKYVGQTLNANGRYDAHCRDEKNTGKLEWLKDLAELELKPVMHVICEVDEAHADQVERALIQAYATEKQPLVNLALMPKYPASVFGEPLKTGYEAMSEEEQRQGIQEYPDPMSLDDAADMAFRFMGDLYPDKQKAKNYIRVLSYRGTVPGAWRRNDSLNGRDVWRYDKTKLVEWLRGKDQRMDRHTSATDYQNAISLSDAALAAVKLLPRAYPNRKLAKTRIRKAATRGEIPEAVKVKSTRGYDIWMFNRDQLFEWLQR